MVWQKLIKMCCFTSSVCSRVWRLKPALEVKQDKGREDGKRYLEFLNKRWKNGEIKLRGCGSITWKEKRQMGREGGGIEERRTEPGFRLRWDWDSAQDRHRHCESALPWSRASDTPHNWKALEEIKARGV